MAAPAGKFPLGRLLATPNAIGTIPNSEILRALQRHHSGDWGEVCAEDRGLNDCALLEGTRLFSVYRTSAGVKFWIITEADRSATTILLPRDY
ncbi:MAG: hypothetical protein HZA93_29540 [Verrucomicrobia bacterium]|nr:hypothetical protein [Verrucomicrobiota bacterium]